MDGVVAGLATREDALELGHCRDAGDYLAQAPLRDLVGPGERRVQRSPDLAVKLMVGAQVSHDELSHEVEGWG